jgi:hypothetical protein
MKRATWALAIVVLVAIGVFSTWSRRSTPRSGGEESAFAAEGVGGQAGASSGVQWVTVRDAREQAFSIQVPRSWKTYGGLFRFSAIDTRLVVDMTSPDGLTNLRIGDATTPPYRVPGPFLRPGPGVAAYVSANVFAAKYGQARFASMCQAVQLSKSNPIAPKYHPAQQAFSHTTGGEAFFSCTKNGAPMSGYVYAETMLMGPGGPGSSWLVVALGSLMAPAAQAAAAGTLLAHAGSTLVMNPVWTRMQDQLNNQAIQQINANTRATIAATQAEDARERGMISAMQNDSFNDVINGVQATQDTATGKQYIVPLGQGGTQWINGNKTVVESGLSPGPGFNRLAPANPY